MAGATLSCAGVPRWTPVSARERTGGGSGTLRPMWVQGLRIEGFRGVKRGDFVFEKHAVIVGPNGCGKSTVVDALSLVLGRHRMVRPLTEHDFVGGDPLPSDRIRIVADIVGFDGNDPDRHTDWFRLERAVPKWVGRDGVVKPEAGAGRRLCAQIGYVARFDREELAVEALRYFHDDDDTTDPFADDGGGAQVPPRLINDLGYFVLSARRTWDGITSFNSELFRRTVSDAAGIPAAEIIAQRDQLRRPTTPVEDSTALRDLVASMNLQLGRLLSQKPAFKLRLTAADSEAVLQALLPHYEASGVVLPVSRHGAGLLSLQSLLLLLEVGRGRKAKGLPFILALEEPELHLAPGLQGRLVAEAIRVADQTICTTHSSRVATMYEPTNVLIMTASAGAARARPLLAAPLTSAATNNERKLFNQNRSRVVDALMHSYVLVPEGRFDMEWLSRLATAGEDAQTAPPFTSVFGVVPTENAAVLVTVEKLAPLRTGIVALVDGDPAGDQYVKQLLELSAGPDAIVQWPAGWTIEDIVGWCFADGTDVLDEVRDGVGASWSFKNVAELVALLRTKNDTVAKTWGLKEDVVAHDAIAGVLREHRATRVAELLDALVSAALGQGHSRLVLVEGSRVRRFSPT